MEEKFDFLIQKHAKLIRENVTNAYNWGKSKSLPIHISLWM